MTTFVRYNEKGEVLATARVDELPEGFEHPFGELAAGESSLRLQPEERRANEAPLLDLHREWKVSPRTNKLVRRPAQTREGRIKDS